MRETVQAHLDEQMAHWRSRGSLPGHRPRVYMVTLTLPHEAEEGRAERLLDEAWRRMRRHARRGHWSRQCLAVREWTPGRDGRGHPHLHVIVVTPYMRYEHVRATWREAALAVGAGEPRGRGIWITVDTSSAAPRSAARYVAKYLTASPDLISVRDWARMASWMVGRRMLMASRGWWRATPPACSCCEQRYARCAPRDSAWIAVGGGERRWAHRWEIVDYDPLSGWCRMRYATDEQEESDGEYGTVSMAECTYPMGDERLVEPIDEKKELDMEIIREDAHLARVKWRKSIIG